MKYLKLIALTGAAILIILGIGFALLHFLRPAKTEPDTKEAVPAVSTDPIELIAEADSVEIIEIKEDSVLPSPTAGKDPAASENRADALSENEIQTVSENDGGSASENEAELIAEEEQDPKTEEADPASDTPAEVLPEDTKAPFFLSYNGNPVIKKGDNFDIHKYIGYADDVDRHVDLEVSGEVNTAAEGSYPLTISLRDDTGKSTAQKMTVQVVAELPAGGGYVGTKEEFADFRAKYRNDNTRVGIDISRWQETVDFEKVKAAGCEFVYMRIGGRDDGELYTDRYFKNNIAGARAAGLQIGIYWHAEESTPAEVRESVNYLMDVLGGEALDFPIAYDWEDFLHFENYGMNIYDLNNNLDVFVEEINARGYQGCLYNSKYYLETVWSSASKHPLWLAHYVNSTNYQGQYFMWQHGCTGRIDGINGDVDLDVLYVP